MTAAAVRRATLALAIVVGLPDTSGFSRILAQSPSTGAIRQHIETLASDKLDGRMTGSDGERLAAGYIVSQLEKIGAKPLPGLDGYRLPFEFTAGGRDGGSTVSTKGPQPRPFGTVEG